MKKRAFKIKTLPKYWDGGVVANPDEDPNNPNIPKKSGFKGFDYGSLINGAATATESSMSNGNQEFASLYRKDEMATKKQVDAGIGAVGAIPGWGQLVAGGLKAGQAVGKATKDEYGIYKNGASSFVDKMFDPNEGIGGLKRMFDEPSFDNIANQLSMGIVGKNTRQEELKHDKKVFEFDKMNSANSSNERAGTMLKNSLPVYQAPAYGREGLKMRTGKRYSSKFSNFK
jgi:hypothetical protein